MKKHYGFTLIELVLFIIISSILVSAILLSYVGSLGQSPNLLQNTIAMQTAQQCAEWYLSQRRLNGYSAVSGTNCTGTLSIPAICAAPSGYTLSGSCNATTIRGDSNYETITLTVSGPGAAQLTLLFGKY